MTIRDKRGAERTDDFYNSLRFRRDRDFPDHCANCGEAIENHVYERCPGYAKSEGAENG